jgi:hypothetical protein
MHVGPWPLSFSSGALARDPPLMAALRACPRRQWRSGSGPSDSSARGLPSSSRGALVGLASGLASSSYGMGCGCGGGSDPVDLVDSLSILSSSQIRWDPNAQIHEIRTSSLYVERWWGLATAAKLGAGLAMAAGLWAGSATAMYLEIGMATATTLKAGSGMGSLASFPFFLFF